MEDIQQLAAKLSENDTGKTSDYLRIKTWALGLQKIKVYPLRLASLLYDREMYAEAEQLYASMWRAAGKQRGRQLEYECGMAYYAGQSCQAQEKKEEALTWYRKANNLKYKNADGATQYYYEQALCAYRCLMKISCER